MQTESQSKMVLLIDDDEDDRMMIAEAIQSIVPSIAVKMADNGKAGIEVLNDLKETGKAPALIILDINMPVMGGKEVLQTIRKDTDLNPVPVAIYTTADTEHLQQFAQKNNAMLLTKGSSHHQMEADLFKILSFAKL